MGKADDLTGRVFNNGMVTVLQRANSNNRKSRWLCSCGCGNTFTAYGFNLKSGKTKSCGCMGKSELSERQMKRTSISLYRLKKDDDPYRNLANAIVAVAADDYRNALQNDNDDLAKSLERFFYSDWYRMLTNLNPNILLELLHKENGGNIPIIYI